MSSALIIFQKNPEPGKVKTRLAATVGNDNALRVYNVLVNHTHAMAKAVDAHKYLYFANFIDDAPEWEGYNLRVQKGDDLGLRMFNAIQEVKKDGHDHVVVIGTDCYELTAEILQNSFKELENSDYCIGPALDGGYYLIGTNSADESVFLGKTWSTEDVFNEAKNSIETINKTLAELPILSDVDYEEDLKIPSTVFGRKVNSISIVIPVLNEEATICGLLDYLLEEIDGKKAEIIVVDGGSTDKTCDLVQAKNVKFIKSNFASRAVQMNAGAAESQYDILYFIHADTIPPKGFFNHIVDKVNEGSDLGCYRFRFQSNHPLLIVNSWFTRFDVMWCRGGDQTLYVTKKVFDEMNGYDTYYSIMEEYDFLRRAQAKYQFNILPYNVSVSARKYRTNSWLKVQLANMKAVKMFNRGEAPETIKSLYKQNLNPY